MEWVTAVAGVIIDWAGLVAHPNLVRLARETWMPEEESDRKGDWLVLSPNTRCICATFKMNASKGEDCIATFSTMGERDGRMAEIR